MMGLSPRALELKEFIAAWIADCGYAPTYDQMKDALGLRSKSGIVRLIDQLESRGHIRRIARSTRAIEILEAAPSKIRCPHCGHPAGSTLCVAEASRAASQPNSAAGTPPESVTVNDSRSALGGSRSPDGAVPGLGVCR